MLPQFSIVMLSVENKSGEGEVVVYMHVVKSYQTAGKSSYVGVHKRKQEFPLVEIVVS